MPALGAEVKLLVTIIYLVPPSTPVIVDPPVVNFRPTTTSAVVIPRAVEMAVTSPASPTSVISKPVLAASVAVAPVAPVTTVLL